MPIIYGVISQSQLGNTVATIFTVAAGQRNVIKLITVVNTDTVARTVGFNVNGTAAANAVTPTAISIAAGASWEWNPSGLTLGPGDTFAGGASVATKLSTTIFGATIS